MTHPVTSWTYLLEIRVHKRGGVEIVQRTDPGTPGPRPVKWLAKFPATVPDFIVVSAAQSAIVGRFEEAKVAPS